MNWPRLAGVAIFTVAVIAGTVVDIPAPTARSGPSVIAADFHVHGMPGDGALPVWELQREAGRRGLDVIAITNHNSNLSWRIADALGLVRPYPLVIPGEELTTLNFHIAAVGVRKMVDPRLPVREAIDAIQRQGGVAIAAHPTPRTWRIDDPSAMAVIDGVEAVHPMVISDGRPRRYLQRLYESTRQSNPTVAAIGSTDYHLGIPLGIGRTYMLVDEVSEAGVLDAIRAGRTVATGPGGLLIGQPEDVAAVRPYLRVADEPNFTSQQSRWLALLALGGLALIVLTD